MLDVGCGAGLVSEPISRLGAEVLAIDAAERNIQVAERHAKLTGAPVRYRHALPEDLADLAGKFDVVMSLEVVEHVASVPDFLAAIGRLVAPGGLLVIGTLNRTPVSFLKAIVGAEYVLRWLPRGTHDWRKFVKPSELEALLCAARLPRRGALRRRARIRSRCAGGSHAGPAPPTCSSTARRSRRRARAVDIEPRAHCLQNSQLLLLAMLACRQRHRNAA